MIGPVDAVDGDSLYGPDPIDTLGALADLLSSTTPIRHVFSAFVRSERG